MPFLAPAKVASDEPLAALETVDVVEKTDLANPARGRAISESQCAPLPAPSSARLEASLSETPFDLDKVNVTLALQDDRPATVLYLAYGSNLCDETFRVKRKIRPLSALNVLVPALALTFDLPGLPYVEPCFANTRYRNEGSDTHDGFSSGGRRSSGVEMTRVQSSDKSPLLPRQNISDDREMQWKKPLVGVVYEVTSSDFARIIATEGGGSGYQDVLVSCHPFAPDSSPSDVVPFEPETSAFKAHTLCAPPRPSRRPDANYAQPSARYLDLLQSGAAEHHLPDEYLAYLTGLQPYTITTRRQRLGRFIFTSLWRPVLIAVFSLNKVFADERGRSPAWLRRVQNAIFTGIWISYDAVFHRTFGDGERTQGRRSSSR